MESILDKKEVVNKDVAIAELIEFVKHWNFEEKEEHEIESDYPQVLLALRKGLLTIDGDKKPVYKLLEPITSTGGNFDVKEIDFRTRIKPMDLANITKGLNVSTQQVEYTLRCLAYISGQPLSVLNKFKKFDYKVVEQVSTVFF